MSITMTNTVPSPQHEATELVEHLHSIMPERIDGKDAVRALKKHGSPHWKQMEWPGFFLEEVVLDNLLVREGPTYKNTQFDCAGVDYVWDIKAHTTHRKSGNKVYSMYLNDAEAMEEAVLDGGLGFIVADIDVEYDDSDNSFFWWRTELKGGLSDYQQENADDGEYEPGRCRKTAFTFERIRAIWIDNLGELEEAQEEGWIRQTGQGQNSNGDERKDKYEMKPHNVPYSSVLAEVRFDE